jgi:tight adherence protein C
MNIQELLPFGLDLQGAFTILAALSAFGCVLFVWSALLAADPLGQRAQRLRQRRDELKAGWVAPRRHSLRQVTAMTTMRSMMRKLDLLRNKTAENVTLRLARAGWRGKDALVVFMVLKILLPFAFGATAFVLFNLIEVVELPSVVGTLLPLAAVVIGAYAPDFYLKKAIKKREAKLQKGLPDALDLLVICAEAGLSLDSAMHRVAKEMERGCPEIADEMGLTAVELGFLPQRRKALENLMARCDLQSMRGVVNTLLQTEKYGTPLAGSLRVLSAEYRSDRMMRAEEKAARLPAILTLPLILFIMPTLFIVVLGPAVLNIMDSLGNM